MSQPTHTFMFQPNNSAMRWNSVRTYCGDLALRIQHELHHPTDNKLARITRENESKSPFLRIAPELRNRIINFVYAAEAYTIDDTKIDVTPHGYAMVKFDGGYSTRRIGGPRLRRQLIKSVSPRSKYQRALSGACRQLYVEYPRNYSYAIFDSTANLRPSYFGELVVQNLT